MRDNSGHYHRDKSKPRRVKRARSSTPKPADRSFRYADMSSHIRKSSAVKMTAVQRDSRDQRDAWNNSANYFCPIEKDMRWAR